MRKTTLNFCLWLIASAPAIAQPDPGELRKKNTYLDAVHLTSLFTSITDTTLSDEIKQPYKNEFFSILNSYGWTSTSTNPIIQKLELSKYYHTKKQGSLQAFIAPSILEVQNTPASTEAPSGNIESAAINAIATFMADRAKEELMYYAIDKIFDVATDNSVAAKNFQSLFPKTCAYVKVLKAGGVYYYSDFSTLKQMVELDLKNLPLTFYNIVPSSDAKDGVYIAGEVYQTVVTGGRITDFINTLAGSDTIWSNPDISKVTHTLELISNALTSPQGSNSLWLNATQLASLDPTLVSPTNVQIFFYGLLFQQLSFQKEFTALMSAIQNDNDVAKFEQAIFKARELAQTLQAFRDSIASVPPKPDLSWYTARLQQGVALVQLLDNDIQYLTGKNIISPSVINNANTAFEVAQDISQKMYVEAASIVLNYLLQNNTLTSDVYRKINFFIQLANLKDEKDFSNFLKSYAAPIGSSSIKRNSDFNISLNGYVGANLGYEYIQNSKALGRNDSWYYGIAAPIGLSFTVKSSVTFFLSVIDLGTLVNARLKNDSTSYSNLKFENFFSPGLGIFYNIPKAPFSVGVYGCVLNNLRTINYTPSKGVATVTESNRNVTRINFSFLIDIPFLTLANKPKSK